MTQLTLNIENPKDVSLIKKLLAKFEGVTVHQTRRHKKSATDEILSDPKLLEAIKEGQEDLKNGRCKELTAAQIKEMLGI